MRIVQVAPTPFGSDGIFGGGERYPLELSRELAREVDCELVTFGRRPGAHREASGLRVRVVTAVAFLHNHPAHPLAPGLFWAISGADVVHTHHMRSTPSRFAAVAARARGAKTAVTDHGLQGGDWGGLLPRLFDRFLTVSRYSADELHAPTALTRVIFGGADPVHFRPDPAAARQGVLFVGRLTPHKGIDRLIGALPPGESLRLAGSAGHDPHPPERNYPQLLRQLSAGKHVDFLGPVSEELLPSLYRSARLLALPSVEDTCYGRKVRVSELLSLATIEAMASGTPVVCSRLGGLPEVVQDGVTGFLVPPGDTKELSERMSELLRNPELAERLGRNAREAVLERFTWRRCAERCLAAYEEMLAPSTSRGAA